MNKEEIRLTDLINMTIEDIERNDSCFLFYDWFCKDSSLKSKCSKLLSNVRSIVKKMMKNGNFSKFDPSKCYVFFKNNCPCYGDGQLYDDIRICDIESGEVIYNICPRDPFGKMTVYCKGYGFECDTKGLSFDSMREVTKWFAT